jgi:tetratricopeptide (TPR) repeat protein
MKYLGLCAERLEMPKTAADLYQVAIRESKNQRKPYSWAFLSYGQFLRQAGNEREALAVLEEAEKICPSAETLSLLGQMVAKTDPRGRKRCCVARSR